MNTHDDGPPDGQLITAELSLTGLQQEFPGYRIWREDICGRVRYIARRQQPGLHPHTVVTCDLAEIRAALEPLQPDSPRPPDRLPRSRGRFLAGVAVRPATPQENRP